MQHLVLVEVEEGQAAQELCAGMLRVQVLQLPEDCGPHMQLLCCVLQSWNGLAHSVCSSHIANVPPPILVRLVSESGMVLCQVCSEPHDLPIVHFLQALGNASFGDSLWLHFELKFCDACK